MDRMTAEARVEKMRKLPLTNLEDGIRSAFDEEIDDVDRALDCLVLHATVEKIEIETTFAKFVADRQKARRVVSATKKPIPRMVFIMDHQGNAGAICLMDGNVLSGVGNQCMEAFQAGEGM